MIKKLAITHSLEKTTYAILRRRSNGNIYNNTSGAEEELGTWNNARKTECAVLLTNQKARYYQADFPAGCDDGVWDAFYFVQMGEAIDITADRLIYLEKFINGAASIAERSMLAAGTAADKIVYAIIRSQDDASVWDTGDEALEEAGTWDNSRLGQCAYAMEDKGAGYYTEEFPAEITIAGTYHILYFEKLGASYDTGDRQFGRDKIIWFGTTESGEVVPTGPRGKAMVNLRDLVTECESFQAAVGAGDADEAKNYLHITAYTPVTGVFARPFGLICRTSNDKDESAAIGENIVGGDLQLQFEQDIPEDYEDEPANAELYFINMYEAILTEMWTLSRQAGKLAINNITLIEGPTQVQEGADIYVNVVKYMVNWGLRKD